METVLFLYFVKFKTKQNKNSLLEISLDVKKEIGDNCAVLARSTSHKLPPSCNCGDSNPSLLEGKALSLSAHLESGPGRHKFNFHDQFYLETSF